MLSFIIGFALGAAAIHFKVITVLTEEDKKKLGITKEDQYRQNNRNIYLLIYRRVSSTVPNK